MCENKKIIDWQLSLKLANGKIKLAEQMLAMFIKQLPTAMTNIQESFAAADYPELQNQAHRLHGATCYCGVPLVKDLTYNIETAIKKNQIKQLNDMVKELMEISANTIKQYETGCYR